MFIRIWILINVLALVFFEKTTAQNLVPNPGFESSTNCPTSNSQINFCNNWTAYRMTPDYYNACSMPGSLYWVPQNERGYQAAATGSAYTSITTYVPGNANYREFLGTTLTSPLQVGQEYTVSFKVSLSDKYQYGSDKIGARFYMTSYSSASPAAIDNMADVFEPSIITDSANWVLVSGKFTPTQPYPYMAIGNFFDDANTNSMNIYPGGSGFIPAAHYYIDDVSVVATTASCPCFDNPSFETTPPGQTAIGAAPPSWTTCTGTSDIQPGNQGVTVTAMDQQTYVAMAGEDFNVESVGQKLCAPLQKNKLYKFGAGVRAQVVFSVGSQPTLLSVWAGTASCAQSQLLDSVLINPTDNQWKMHCFSFTPNDNYDYLTFYPWCTSNPNCSGGTKFSYVFIDNLRCDSCQSQVPPSCALVADSATTTPVTACTAKTGTATVWHSGGTPPFSFVWSPSGGTASSASGLSAGTYTVVVTDSAGCTASKSATVDSISCPTVTPPTTPVPVVVPNVFSPGADNVNDVFVITGIEYHPGSSLEIFNRWGNKVYQSNDYKNTWNGTHWKTGTSLSPGVYYYILTLPDGEHKTGFLTLIKLD